MEQVHNRLNDYMSVKLDVILDILGQIEEYRTFSERTLLNLSFRQGDILHSLWSSYEEKKILPILVELGLKPVASIVIQDDTDDEINEIYVSYCCRKIIITNNWGVKILLICKKFSYNDEELYKLANETNDYNRRGIMYGYNDLYR